MWINIQVFYCCWSDSLSLSTWSDSIDSVCEENAHNEALQAEIVEHGTFLFGRYLNFPSSALMPVWICEQQASDQHHKAVGTVEQPKGQPPVLAS